MSSLVDLVFPAFRFYTSQVLVFMFTYWVTCIPFVLFALDRVYKLLRKIR